MVRIVICSLVAASLLVFSGREATAQRQREGYRQRSEQEINCNVQREPSGMVRGDRIPRGCVLPSTGGSRYDRPQGHQWTTALGPCEQYSERIFHTPNPKRSVLTNAARICRPILEASDPANWPGGDDFESFNSNFGSDERHFGSTDRHFGSSQSNFGSSRRHFGSSQRNFGSSRRHFGSTQRNFGTSKRSPGTTRRGTSSGSSRGGGSQN
jgi:hypothetical protein